MINTFISIILILTPFLIIFLFKDKTRAFAYLFNIFLLFQLILSLLLQSLGLFNNKWLLFVYTVIALLSFLYFWSKKSSVEFSFKKEYIFTFLIFVIIFFQLWSVHNNYSGIITTEGGFETVENYKYPHPYFSDEWIISLFAKNSEELGFANKNPMDENSPIKNLLVPFFSLTSSFFAYFNLDPINQYYLLPLLTGFLITIFAFILLRKIGIDYYSAGITTVLITYIANGTNLPGIWYTLPYTLGLIIYLNLLYFIASNDNKMIIFTSIFATFIYPPIFVFILPALIFYWKKELTSKKFLLNTLIASLTLIIIAILIFSIFVNEGFLENIKIIIEYLYRPGVEDGIPRYTAYFVMPIITIFLAIFGGIQVIKDKLNYIIAPTITGIFFWFIYGITQKVFIIEYPRIVIITSVLLTIISGFGLSSFIKKINKKEQIKPIGAISLATLLIIGFTSLFYTQINQWDKFVLQKNGQTIGLPAAPANKYLTKEDLHLFRNIKNEKFISNEWKSLVLGISTNNIPMKTKASIISNNYISHEEFSTFTCEQKQMALEALDIKYIYVRNEKCSFLKKVGQSESGFNLYKFN